jgi:hypothetical protein
LQIFGANRDIFAALHRNHAPITTTSARGIGLTLSRRREGQA